MDAGALAAEVSITSITSPNYAQFYDIALNKRTILYVPGFQRQVFKRLKLLSGHDQSKRKNKGSVLVAEFVYSSQMITRVDLHTPKMLIIQFHTSSG